MIDLQTLRGRALTAYGNLRTEVAMREAEEAKRDRVVARQALKELMAHNLDVIIDGGSDTAVVEGLAFSVEKRYTRSGRNLNDYELVVLVNCAVCNGPNYVPVASLVRLGEMLSDPKAASGGVSCKDCFAAYGNARLAQQREPSLETRLVATLRELLAEEIANYNAGN